MCLVVKGKIKKAKEDILCYKILRMDIITHELSSPYYYSMQWKIGEEYKNKEKAKINFPNHIENGYFHTYELKYDACVNCRYNSGLSYNDVVFEAVIPKGTYYYNGTHYGRRGYASKKLKIIRMVF